MPANYLNYADDPDDRDNEIGQAIDYAADGVADVVDELLSALAARGGFHVHRAWSASVEREQVAKAAAEAAVRVVLANGWVNVSAETQALWAEKV